ncbi:YbeD family protein [Reinekea sp.]|jgi:putative lipoic acid-binding regulatory protein|uniref:HP0495 family protein n=1 Tax=Reinekea sp. TaxID=1970455 RepID=UPI00398A1643
MQVTDINSDKAPKIVFPCADYMIKVVGDETPLYRGFVASVLTKFDSRVTPSSFTEQPSKNGRFVSLTVRMHIEKEADLASLFEELKNNSMVKMVL